MFLLQMAGHGGSGKSTLAKKIAEKSGAIIIDNDIIKSAILELNIDDISWDTAGKLTYNINFKLAEYYLEQNKNVIIDTPCRYPFILEKGKKLSLKYGALYKYIECYVDNYEETAKRLRQRNKLLSQVDESKVDENHYKKWLNETIFPKTEYLKIETNRPIEEYIEKCMRYINKM